MSTYVLMRILESAPHRYDLGIRLLTLGRLDRAYDRLVRYVKPGQRVLDLGCGTGALAVRAARLGAAVRAVDVNAEMLEIAEQRARTAGLAAHIEFRTMGVAELDHEPAETYEVVMSGLCFSELSDDEIRYTLRQVRRLLRPGGALLIADEVKPPDLVRRIVHALLRAPLVALTYLVTQQTTHAVDNLPAQVTAAGLAVESLHTNVLASFLELVARKPDGAR